MEGVSVWDGSLRLRLLGVWSCCAQVRLSCLSVVLWFVSDFMCVSEQGQTKGVLKDDMMELVEGESSGPSDRGADGVWERLRVVLIRCPQGGTVEAVRPGLVWI